jgi:hypothetical protein
MESDRFDALTRTQPAAGSRRRALVAALGGSLAALVGGRSRSEAGKKKRKKRTPCPAPTVCPPRDTCPVRTCCVCNATSPTPGCQFAPPTTPDVTLSAVCQHACGGPGTYASATSPADPASGQTLACSHDRSDCLFVACPI